MIALARRSVVGAIEALKDLGLLIGWNTYAGVADTDPNFILIQLGSQCDYAARRCRLDRIFDEVIQDLADPFAVEDAIRQISIGLVDQRQAVLLGLQPQPS